jgi:adenylate cyclase
MKMSDHLANALQEVRMNNARRINQVRLIGVGAFLLTMFWLEFRSEPDGRLDIMLYRILAYFGIALILAVGSRYSSRILLLSRFAVPVFDLPIVFAIQWLNVGSSAQPTYVSEFSISIFMCLIMLSAFTLDRRHILLCFGLAVVFEQVLEIRAGIGGGGRVFSTLVLGLATWICIFAGSNRLALVETVTKADARRRRLQRYFSPGVGELLEEGDEDAIGLGQECELSIIFVDIRGFTALSEKLESSEVVALLNSYHAHMVDAIFRHGGTLDKYLGDGLVAYFNSPIEQPDHAERAVRCGLDMIAGLETFNAERLSSGDPPLRMGIGIHSGRAIVGDIGAPHRREFTAIGSAVNLASRLEGMTKEFDRPLLVSEATADLCAAFSWEDIGCHSVRGSAGKIRLFTIDSLPEKMGKTA